MACGLCLGLGLGIETEMLPDRPTYLYVAGGQHTSRRAGQSLGLTIQPLCCHDITDIEAGDPFTTGCSAAADQCLGEARGRLPKNPQTVIAGY